MTTNSFPHVVHLPLWARLLGSVLPLFVLYALLFQFQGLIQYWNRHTWVIRIGMLITGALGLIALPALFLERTIFNLEEIEHRNGFGMTKKYDYSDITFFRYVEGKTLEIYFSDKSKIDIWAGSADLIALMELIDAQMEMPVPIEAS